MSVDEAISSMALQAVALLQQKRLSLATAESCTGGSIAAAITSVAGCSSVMRGGVVAYHNDVKATMLGVSADDLRRQGAVSESVVRQMAEGVAERFGACCSVATSGVAGPGGGTADKPVGTVWIAVKAGGKTVTKLLRMQDEGRVKNIKNTVAETLRLLVQQLHEQEESA